MTNGRVSSGAIAAFTLEEQNGRPVLVLAWISRDMVAPAAPAVANGLVFGLSAGDVEYTRDPLHPRRCDRQAAVHER